MTQKMLCLILGGALLTAGAARAQGGAAPDPDQPQPRGLFMAALAPVLGGVVERLFDWAIAPPSGKGGALPTVTLANLAVNGQYYAGLAYEAYVVGANGQPQRVDPVSHTFRTGDQFLIKYVPNMPGQVEVTNVNPHGQEFKLGTWSVAAGQQITLPMQGTFQFSGPSGEEVLKIGLTPCTSGSASRDVVINASTAVNYGALLPACGGAQPARSRDIVVNAQGGTAYAVSALSPQELGAKSVDTRVVTVRLRHSR